MPTPPPYDLVIGLDRSNKKTGLCLITTATGQRQHLVIASAPAARPPKTGVPIDSGQPSALCLDSNWVNCDMFLDCSVAFDHGTGKRVEVTFELWPARWSPNRCLAGCAASVPVK